MVSNGMTLLNLDSKTHQYFLGLPNFPNIKGFGGITWILSGILVGAQRKGEISTTSGTSVADTTPAEVEVVDQTDDEGGLSLAELEKECEKQLALAMAQPEETPTDTPQPEETPTGTSFGSKGGGGKGRGNPVKPIPASGNSGNLALALTSGGGLTPSQLHTQELETEVVGELKKFSEEQFEAKVEELKQHHEFKSYCDAVRLEIGEQEDAAPEEKWEFGEQECYLDVVGLMVWIRARENMRRALGVQVPALPMGDKVEPPAAMQVEPAKVEAPAAKVEAVETPAPSITPSPHTMFFPPSTPALPVTPTPALPAPTPALPAPTPALPAPTPALPAPTPALPAPTPALPATPTPPPAPTAPTPALPATPTPPPAPTPPTPALPATAVPVPGDLSARVDQLAVAVAADVKPTSSTHRKEYMAFLRAAKNPTHPQLFWEPTIRVRKSYRRFTVGKVVSSSWCSTGIFHLSHLHIAP